MLRYAIAAMRQKCQKSGTVARRDVGVHPGFLLKNVVRRHSSLLVSTHLTSIVVIDNL